MEENTIYAILIYFLLIIIRIKVRVYNNGIEEGSHMSSRKITQGYIKLWV